MSSNVRLGLGRLSRIGDKVGLRYRDLITTAVIHPVSFVNGLRRLTDRSRRKFEGAVRAKERSATRISAGHPPASFDDLLEPLTQKIGVLEIFRMPRVLSIGVADVDLVSTVLFLTLRVPGAKLLLNGEHVSLGEPRVKSRIQHCKTAEISFSDSRFETRCVQVEGYEPVLADKWVSANDTNTVMRAYYGNALERPGHVRAIEILGAPVLEHRSEEFDVDAVYTWVNHEDPSWKAMHAEWSAHCETGHATAATGDADAITRFHNNDELRYSLRSLECNTPWLRRIFVFSNCAPPAWLYTEHSKVHWVRHEEVIPAEHLPTFNSHVIESFLHWIPGLAEHFIYLNDDFLVMKEMKKVDFFTEIGMSRARFENYGMVSGEIRDGDPDYLNAARNSAALIRDSLNFAPTQLHQHVPYALLRPVLEELEARFCERIDAFRSNRFRRTSDINIPSFLYHHYAIGTGRSVNSFSKSLLVKSNALDWKDRLRKAEKEEYDFLCINEGGAEAPSAGWHEAVQTFLKSTFPVPAEWETSRIFSHDS